MVKRDFSRNFGQVLKEARLMRGWSQEELAHECDLDRTFISMLERGVKIPTLTTLDKISRALSIMPAQILSRMQQLEMGEQKIKPAKKSSLRPPFYGTSVSCGRPVGGDYIIERELSLDESMIKDPVETFFIKASGDSMLPTIWDGDILIVNQGLRPKNGSIVLAQIENEFTIKRFFKNAKGVRLVPDNSNFKEVQLSETTENWICGIVTGISRLF